MKPKFLGVQLALADYLKFHISSWNGLVSMKCNVLILHLKTSVSQLCHKVMITFLQRTIISLPINLLCPFQRSMIHVLAANLTLTILICNKYQSALYKRTAP